MHPDEQIAIGEAVRLDIQLAGVGSRGVAAIIDYAIMVVAQIVVLVIVLAVQPGEDAFAAIFIVLEVAILLGYPVVSETLWRGRTVGKAVMGLRVVRDDGGPIRFRHAFARGLMGLFVDKPGITYTLGAFIPIAFGSQRRKRLGDMAAGTIVLQERVPGKLHAPVTMPPPLAAWAGQLDMTSIDDALALRIRHFIARAGQLSPEARASLEHSLAAEVVARVGPPPADAPAWAVLAAVLAERRQRAFATSQPVASPYGGYAAGSYAAMPIGPEHNPANPWDGSTGPSDSLPPGG